MPGPFDWSRDQLRKESNKERKAKEILFHRCSSAIYSNHLAHSLESKKRNTDWKLYIQFRNHQVHTDQAHY